jgi:exopolysaccharide biosynthesis protein
MLVRDSAIVPEVETEGQASFIARNPRTAVGIARSGRRLILAVVDGRQKGYSDGMTLRETAELMRALGARDAINLDGGGSSTLVYRTQSGMRIANRPSDSLPNGIHFERAVGDALAIVRSCR